MRLWSLHPRHLDTRAFVACWREWLLAYHVLRWLTKGYKNHPQLMRFRATPDPIISIELYLHALCDEADARGYKFDRTKLGFQKLGLSDRWQWSMLLTHGQLEYEVKHLRNKILLRAPQEIYRLDWEILPHPIFSLTPGSIEDWEKVD